MSDTINQIRQGITAHTLWKMRLSDAISSGASAFDPAIVEKNDLCPFGQWLHRTIDPALRGTSWHNKIIDMHRLFHKEAAGVLRLAITGKKPEALKAMTAGSNYANISSSLTMAMMGWIRDIEGKS